MFREKFEPYIYFYLFIKFVPLHQGAPARGRQEGGGKRLHPKLLTGVTANAYRPHIRKNLKTKEK